MSDKDDIREVLARYTRNADARDGEAQGQLFTEDCVTEIFANVNGKHVLTHGPMHGNQAIVHATNEVLPKHKEGGWSHHFTMDHIITVDGDKAKMNAHFLVAKAHAILKPESGWPAGTYGSQGHITIDGTGYYICDLTKASGEWKIYHHRVVNDLPWIFPS